jgi:hypothetical protein
VGRSDWCQLVSASTSRSSSPRSRKMPRHSLHWSTVTLLRSYVRIAPWHLGQTRSMPLLTWKPWQTCRPSGCHG